jgi:hypothetical protein
MLTLFAVVAALVLLVIVPFYVMILISGVPLGDKAEPAYVNGLITANGIFLGVILSTAMSKSKDLSYGRAFWMFLPTAVFFVVMLSVFQDMIKSKVTVVDLAFLEASLFFSVAFFWVLLFEPFEEKKAITVKKTDRQTSINRSSKFQHCNACP